MNSYTEIGYSVADIAALQAIPPADRPAFEGALVSVVSTNQWFAFDPSGTTGGVIPTSGTGRWYPLHRETLTANRTYFVRTDGNDNNTGLANTAGGAFLTIQKAIDTVASLDISIFDVTIQVANGTYNQQLFLKPVIGAGTVFITGDTTTPSNVIITSPTTPTITSTTQSLYDIKGFQLSNSFSGFRLGILSQNGNIRFGNLIFTAFPSGGYHLTSVGASSKIECSANYSISGGAEIHAISDNGGFITVRGITITLTGTPNFSQSFAWATVTGVVDFVSNTYSGSATGSQYTARLNGVVFTNGGTLPGNAAGTTQTGGQYA